MSCSPGYFPITETSGPTPSSSPLVPTQPTLVTWKGFKLVGDNIDKNVRRRHQTVEKQTQSLHYFHYYAVKDRVDLTEFDDIAPEKPLDIDANIFLPTRASVNAIETNFTTYIER